MPPASVSASSSTVRTRTTDIPARRGKGRVGAVGVTFIALLAIGYAAWQYGQPEAETEPGPARVPPRAAANPAPAARPDSAATGAAALPARTSAQTTRFGPGHR